MKRKTLLFFATLASVISLAFSATACDSFPKDTSNQSSTPPTIEEEWGTVHTIQAAYTRAQSLGYSGTLEEFIASISGKDGLTPHIGENGNWWIGETDLGVKAEGVDGEDGADGEDGKDGENGLTPHIGANGNWWIGETDLGVKAEGVDGEDGADGEDGKDGENGLTPHIGANGNWWIGETDLGVKAEGEDGEDLTACAHEYSTWKVGVAATCESMGYSERSCSLCGNIEYKFFAPEGHIFTDWMNLILTEATYMQYATCMECGLSKIQVVNSECNHENMYEDSRYEPTCTNDGYIFHICCDCGATVDKEVIPAIGHDFITDEEGYDLYCNNCGEHCTHKTLTEEGYCIECNTFVGWDAVCLHENIYEDGYEATCTENGYACYICYDCGETIKEWVISATGHDFLVEDGTYGEYCNNCGEYCTHESLTEERYCVECNTYIGWDIACKHDKVYEERVEATCTEEGWVVRICNECSFTVDKEVIPATGHQFADGVCGVCGEHGEEVKPPVEECEHVKTEMERVESTCTEDGYISYICQNCDYIGKEVILATGHDFLAEDGTYGEYCNNCNAYCAHEALTEEGYCGGCYTFVVWNKKCRHENLYEEDYYEPTCTEDGYVYYVCYDCGELVSEEVIPATGHSETYEEYVEATCIEDGAIFQICYDCGDTVSEEIIPATGHQMNDRGGCNNCDYCTHIETETVRTEATCTQNGVEGVCCVNCNLIFEYTEIPTAGHQYEDGICIVCGASDYTGFVLNGCYENADADERFFFKGNKVEASKYGYKAGLAAYEIRGNIIYFDWYYIVPGYTALVYESVIEIGKDYFTVINIYGYSITMHFVELEEEPCFHENMSAETVAANCMEYGYTQYTCADCGYSYKDDYTETRLHEYGEDGCCVYCKYALDTTCNHENTYTESDEPTCIENGYVWNICYECGEILDEEMLAVTDHRLNDQGACDYCGYCAHTTTKIQHIAATCNFAGYTRVFCVNCQEDVKYIASPALGHQYENGVCGVCGAKDYTGTVLNGYYENIDVDGEFSGVLFKDNVMYIVDNRMVVDVGMTITCEVQGNAVILTLHYNNQEHTLTGIVLGTDYIMFGEGHDPSTGNYTFYLTKLEEEICVHENLVVGETVAPTCSNYGYTTYTCADCAVTANIYDYDAELLSHEYGEDGCCVYCGEECDHSYDSEGVCVYCGLACKHEDTFATIGEPTCTEDGFSYRVCNNCGNTVSEEVIPATGHQLNSDTGLCDICFEKV